ncbi:MAG: methylenetetrahydrofolate--tRNA-(uracil(54)-C(5))-methyltransferase (FADH(2)-oxidizing) TrmFO, partial [Bdellovibrionales bacterium GWB1_52_6]
MSLDVHVIGAGLAGCEAAFFLAERGVPVVLHEMRPSHSTPAHKTRNFAELVCSNSLKSKSPHSASGMLKAEMACMGSLILRTADRFSVPAGEALAVDRDLFSEAITATLRSHPKIQVIEEDCREPIPDSINLLASGPLTSENLSQWLAKTSDADNLYFYDAIAPVIEAGSIDSSRAFLANRYDKGEEEAYLNCPLNEAEYYAFVDALITAEKVAPRSFEKEKLFQGCQPIESIVATGRDSLRFGPMKPVGLVDPATQQRPYAVVQLRAENRDRTAFNLVGFQTKLKYSEQARVFRLIPALHKVEFLRMGSIHRNTYLCGPRVLNPDFSFRGHPKIYAAGQMTGVEGYVESTAIGLIVADFIYQRIAGRPHSAPPGNTALGALIRHVSGSDPNNYQPAGMHFGLLDPS